jgi:hypothetical protein
MPDLLERVYFCLQCCYFLVKVIILDLVLLLDHQHELK